MFESSEAFSSFAVRDVGSARSFYEGTLGLTVSDEMGALRLHIAGSRVVFVYPKDDHVPAGFTVLNFPVEDIAASVQGLEERGVSFERYPDFDADEHGIVWSDGQGPSIAWFRDPSGNVLSVLQVPAQD